MQTFLWVKFVLFVLIVISGDLNSEQTGAVFFQRQEDKEKYIEYLFIIYFTALLQCVEY